VLELMRGILTGLVMGATETTPSYSNDTIGTS